MSSTHRGEEELRWLEKTSSEDKSMEDKLRLLLGRSSSSQDSHSALSHRLLDLLVSSLSTEARQTEEMQGGGPVHRMRPPPSLSSSSSFTSSRSYSSEALQIASSRSSTVDSVATADFSWDLPSANTQIAPEFCAMATENVGFESLSSMQLCDSTSPRSALSASLLSHSHEDDERSCDPLLMTKRPSSFDWWQMSAGADCATSQAQGNRQQHPEYFTGEGVEMCTPAEVGSEIASNDQATAPAPLLHEPRQKATWPAKSPPKTDLSGVLSNLSAALAAAEEKAHHAEGSQSDHRWQQWQQHQQEAQRATGTIVVDQRPSPEPTAAASCSSRPPLEEGAERVKKKRRRWNEVSRPFQCPHCPKSYGTRSHLNTHLRSVCHGQSSGFHVSEKTEPVETATSSSPPWIKSKSSAGPSEECSHHVNTRSRQVSDVSSASSLRDYPVCPMQHITSPSVDVVGLEHFPACHSESFPNELLESYSATAERPVALEAQVSSSSHHQPPPSNRNLIEKRASENQEARRESQALPHIDAEELLRQLDGIRTLLQRVIGAQNQTAA